MEKEKKESLKKFINRNLSQLLYLMGADSVSPPTETPFFPVRLYIEPTNACNLRCVHCHHNNIKSNVFKRETGLMKWNVFTKVIDEIKEENCEISLNAQGEPLLHPKIIDMVRYAKKNNVFVSLLTNATKLNIEIAKKLVSLELDRIVFSFDSVVEEEYESIREHAGFKNTLLNILNFLKINEVNSHPTFVCCSIIPQERNKHSIQKYDKYFNSLPVDTIFHSSLLTLSGNSGIANEVDLQKLRNNYKEKQHPICRVPWEMMTINWDGKVTACGLDFNVLFPIGDISKNTLKEIWNSKEMQTFRKAHCTGNYSEIEQDGILCSECNSLYDDEYNLRNYQNFVENDLYRKCEQYFTTSESDQNMPNQDKLKRLKNEISRLKTMSNSQT